MESAEKEHGVGRKVESLQQEIKNLAKIQQNFLRLLQSFLAAAPAPPADAPPILLPLPTDTNGSSDVRSNGFLRDAGAASSYEIVGNGLTTSVQSPSGQLSRADSKVLKSLNTLHAEVAVLEEERVYLRHKLQQINPPLGYDMKPKIHEGFGCTTWDVEQGLACEPQPSPPPARLSAHGRPLPPAEDPPTVADTGGCSVSPVFYKDGSREFQFLHPNVPHPRTDGPYDTNITGPQIHKIKNVFEKEDGDGDHFATRSSDKKSRKRKALTRMKSIRPDDDLGSIPSDTNSEGFKEKVKAQVMKPALDVSRFYKKHGIWQYIARHHMFEHATFAVIACNALWISIDTDLNDADVLLHAHWGFQLVENAFCAYFSLELIVRFQSFKLKWNCLKDPWFVFDSILVTMMILETWVIGVVIFVSGGGGLGSQTDVLRLVRLLRLSRMARMARLVRAVPELAILIKGMIASMRSVLTTFLLLVIVIYIFAIVMTQLTEGGRLIPADSVSVAKWNSVPQSMYTLWLYGVLCLDFSEEIVDQLFEVTAFLGMLYYLFILLAPFTVMNILIGVLCEVVSAVATSEKEALMLNFARGRLEQILRRLDTDMDGFISKIEFLQLLDVPEACRVLHDLGIDVVGLLDFADTIFETDVRFGGDEEGIQLKFEDFVDLVLQLRGSTYATVKDIVELRKMIRWLGTQTATLFEELFIIQGHGSPQGSPRQSVFSACNLAQFRRSTMTDRRYGQ